MKTVKIVIGSSYGDEGKGLATDYFAKKAKEQNKNCVVVLHNGGFQRGHTVVHDDIRHVFHCFSSGTFEGATTYYAPTFILNPIFFKDEYDKLCKLGYEPKIIASGNCAITTPYDVMINQIIEEWRGDARHGSCGYGIWETVVRNRTNPFILNNILRAKNKDAVVAQELFRIRKTFIFQRLEEYGMTDIPIKTLKMIFNDNIIDKYIEDLNFMLSHIEIVEPTILNNFDYIIFEGSQGLLLTRNNPNSSKDFLTASHTDLTNPSEMIHDLQTLGYLKDIDIETVYITRTYLTRHGAGDFPQECPKEKINAKMFDLTNIPNTYQGIIRYGYIDIEELQQRIKEDSEKIPNNNFCLFVTHLNETNDCFYTKNDILIPVKTTDNVKYISTLETKIEEV